MALHGPTIRHTDEPRESATPRAASLILLGVLLSLDPRAALIYLNKYIPIYMNMYVCGSNIHIYTYICIETHASRHYSCVHVCMYVCMHACMYKHMSMCTHTYTCVLSCVCVHMCMCVYRYVCIYKEGRIMINIILRDMTLQLNFDYWAMQLHE